MNLQRYSFFSRLLIFACMLTVVPVCFLGYFSYQKFSKTIDHKVVTAKFQTLQQTHMNIEHILRTADISLTQFTYSEYFVNAYKEPLDMNKFQLFNQVRHEVNYLQLFNTHITDIIIYNQAQNWYLDQKGFRTLEQSPLAETTLDLESASSSYWELVESGALSDSPDACPTQIALIKPLPLNSYVKTGNLITLFSSCQLSPDLVPGNDPLETFMILDSSYRVLTHTSRAMLGVDLSGETLLDDIKRLGQHEGQLSARVQDQEFVVLFRKSNYNHWTYVYLTPVRNVTRESLSLGLFTAATALVILALSLWFAFVGSRYMYNPIRHVYRSVVAGGKPFNPVYKDEIRTIGETFHQLAKSQSSLEEELRGQVKHLRTLFMMELIQGHIAENIIRERLAKYRYSCHSDHYCVMTVQIDSLKDSRFSDNDYDLMMFAVNNMAEELIPESERLTPLVFNASQVTIFGGSAHAPEPPDKRAMSYAEILRTEIRRYLKIQVSFGISRVFNNLHKVPKAYQESLVALNYRLHLGNESIIAAADLASERNLRYAYPQYKFNELIQALQAGEDGASADRLTKELLDDMFRQGLNPHETQWTLIRFLVDIVEHMQNWGVRFPLQSDNRFIVHQLLQRKTAEEIGDWFRNDVVRVLFDQLRDRSQSEFQDISQNVIRIIHEQFDSGISLESCAAQLNYSPNHVSAVFRKQMNLSFSEYLSLYRHQMAKTWLAETDLPIKEIAEKLQYSNSQNFIRSFRKIEGLTPGQYKQLPSPDRSGLK